MPSIWTPENRSIAGNKKQLLWILLLLPPLPGAVAGGRLAMVRRGVVVCAKVGYVAIVRGEGDGG